MAVVVNTSIPLTSSHEDVGYVAISEGNNISSVFFDGFQQLNNFDVAALLVWVVADMIRL